MGEQKKQFINEDGKTSTIFIENPIAPVDTEALSVVRDLIVSTSTFIKAGGPIVEKKAHELSSQC
ncbi:DUF2922 domain-containing protein [Bacillus sp. JJ1533]|uniref:DUF2922 domain-containing protein n=1 Tax=Bacillus sp. JJ1533 TaxID=3122959 RepID=UPI0030002D45